MRSRWLRTATERQNRSFFYRASAYATTPTQNTIPT